MKFRSYGLLRAILLTILLLPHAAGAIDITATGDWTSLSITANDLTAGAGSNLTEQYESSVDQVAIDVFNTNGSTDSWRIDVKRTDSTWSLIPVLSVKRYDAGAGAGSISGGLGYQAVTTTDMSFFSGAGDRIGVHIQLRLSNFSVSIPPGNYSTTVTYTVVDI